MTTLDQLVTRTIRRLTGAVGRDRFNVLDTSLTPSATSVPLGFDLDVNVVAGALLEVEYEQMIVTSVDEENRTVTVIRGWNDTAQANHADNCVVFLEPRFPRQAVFDALVAELRALPRQIYAVDTVDVTFPRGVNTVDLGTAGEEVYRVLDAWRTDDSGLDRLRRARLQLARDVTAGVYESGYGVTIEGGLTYDQATELHVTYARSLETDTITASTDLSDDIGVGEPIADVVMYLAGAALLMDKESLRYDQTRQGQSRDAAEVPADAIGTLAKRWRDEGLRRLSGEITRALELHGWTM